MRNFLSMLSEYIQYSQLHYSSLKARNNNGFCADHPDARIVMLTAASFSLLSGSLDGVNYTPKIRFFPQNIL